MATKTRLPAIEGWFTIDARARACSGSRCTTCGTLLLPAGDVGAVRNPGVRRRASSTRCRSSRPGHGLVVHDQPLRAARAVRRRPTRSCRTRSPRSSSPTRSWSCSARSRRRRPDGAARSARRWSSCVDTLFEDDDPEYVVWKWRPVAAMSTTVTTTSRSSASACTRGASGAATSSSTASSRRSAALADAGLDVARRRSSSPAPTRSATATRATSPARRSRRRSAGRARRWRRSYAACASGATALDTARAQHPRRPVRRRPRGRRRHHAQGLPRAERGRARATIPTGCASACSAPPTRRTSGSTPAGAWSCSAPPHERLRQGEGEERRARPRRTRTRATARRSREDEVLASPIVVRPAAPARHLRDERRRRRGRAVEHRVRPARTATPTRCASRRSRRSRRRYPEHRASRCRTSRPTRPRSWPAPELDVPRLDRRRAPTRRPASGPRTSTLAEVYDLSSALELDWYENIGLCKPGEAERLLHDGDTTHRRPHPGEPERRPRLLRRGRPRAGASPRCASSRGSCAARPATARSRARAVGAHGQPGPVRPRLVASSWCTEALPTTVDLTFTAERGGVPRRGRGPGSRPTCPRGAAVGRHRARASPRHLEWERALFDARWAVVSWPEEYGGRERQPHGVADLRGGVLPGRRARSGSPRTASSCSRRRSSSSAPPEQQDRILPRDGRGRGPVVPGLVGARTPAATSPASQSRAVRDDARRRLAAHRPEDVDDPRRVLRPTCSACSAPTPRPSATGASPTSSSPLDADGRAPCGGFGRLDGDEGFAEVFLDDVFVPDADVLGEVNEGWRVAMATTGSERGLTLRSPGRFLADRRPARRPLPRARARAPTRRCATTWSQAWMDAEAYRWQTFRTVTRHDRRRAARRRVEPHQALLVRARRPPARDRARACSAPTPSSTTTGWMKGYQFALAGPDLRRHQRDPAQHRRRARARPAAASSAMRFAFTDDQLAFRDAVRDLLAKECPPDARARARGRRGRAARRRCGRSSPRWACVGAARARGRTAGSASTELDLVLLLEETGRAALPEPVVEHAVRRAAARSPSRRRRCSPAARPLTAPCRRRRRLVPYADRADWSCCSSATSSSASSRDADVDARRRARRSTAPAASRDVAWTPSAATPRRRTADAALAFDRGALGTAAQLVGLAPPHARHHRRVRQGARAVRRADRHRSRRSSTTSPTPRLALEFARPLVYRAAWSLAHGDPERAGARLDGQGARPATPPRSPARARRCRCHGAIGYTFEYDLHLWMKRAWALAAAWGDAAWHRGARRTRDPVTPTPSRSIACPRPTSSTPSAPRSASAAAGWRRSTPPTSARTCSRRSSSAPASTRRAVEDVIFGCVDTHRPAGRRHRPHVLARRRPARARCPATTDRPPVRLVAAGRALRRAGRDERHHRPRRRRRRAEHEHDPDLVGDDSRPSRSASPTRSPARRAGSTRYGTQEVSQFRGAEMIAEKWDISREDMEAFALESHQRAHPRASTRAASSARSCRSATSTADEGPRRGTSLEKMADAARRSSRAAGSPPRCRSQISDARGRAARRVRARR